MFISNKYTKWYYNIINVAKMNQHSDYVEKHHIIPKSLGGNNTKSNIVRLSARQHFICHLLLVKMTEGDNQQKMKAAIHFMSNCERKEKYCISSKLYERIKVDYANSIKGSNNPLIRSGIDRHGKNNPMFGKKLSKERRSAIKAIMASENHPNAKLTDKEVIQILELYWVNEVPDKQLATLFEVSVSEIKKLVNGDGWHHVHERCSITVNANLNSLLLCKKLKKK